MTKNIEANKAHARNYARERYHRTREQALNYLASQHATHIVAMLDENAALSYNERVNKVAEYLKANLNVNSKPAATKE